VLKKPKKKPQLCKGGLISESISPGLLKKNAPELDHIHYLKQRRTDSTANTTFSS
jgi:hypothetical protein